MTDFTEGQLAALKRAYASGVTRVRYEGKETEYRSLAEMERIISRVEGEIAAAAGKPRAVAGFASFRRS